MRSRIVVVVGTFALAAIAGAVCARAQQPRDAHDVRRSVAAGSTAPAGTASVAGAVLTDDTSGAPVRGALVTIGENGAASRTVITDDAGRFTFRGLPAGRFTLTAKKTPYITTEYGARRPGGPGTTLSLGDGQTMADLVVRMPRGAVITGVITDDAGAPMPDVSVFAVPASVPPARAQAAAPPLTPPFVTDDRGVYRIFGLMPGDYIVAAAISSTLDPSRIGAQSEAEVDAIFRRLEQRASSPVAPQATGDASAPKAPPAYGYAPVLYPGTSVTSEAQTIHLAEGDERDGISFTVTPVRMATIQGMVTGFSGPPSGLSFSIDPIDTDAILPAMPLAFAVPAFSPPDAAGRFTYTNVAPGRYTITARTSTGMWASADTDVHGDDVSGLVLALQPALRLSGRVALDPSTAGAPPDFKNVHVQLVPVGSGPARVMNINRTTIGRAIPVPGAVQKTGEFEVTGILPGAYDLVPMLANAGGWWARSAMLDGHDLLDAPLTIAPGADLAGVVVTLTNRHSELTGKLEDAAGAPVLSDDLVAFPADRTLWRVGSRRVAMARPATDGVFTMRDLPGGDYLLAAVTDIDPDTTGDPALLSQLASAAIPVTIKDGAVTRQDVKISR